MLARSLPAQGTGGRIRSRPRTLARTSVAGRRALGLDARRDALLQVPPDVSKPVPLFIALHGAGQTATWMLDAIAAHADAAGVAVLAPFSRDSTWDAIRADYGADVSGIDRALDKAYGLVSVDPARVSIGGFSDGATYALSLGRINGVAFGRVAAFSPGFVIPGTAEGKPEFFIAHGTADQILPIDRCSRRIVPALRREGYAVTYREFDGGHTIPDAVAKEAFAWLQQPTRPK
jgi:predicted esterase